MKYLLQKVFSPLKSYVRPFNINYTDGCIALLTSIVHGQIHILTQKMQEKYHWITKVELFYLTPLAPFSLAFLLQCISCVFSIWFKITL